MLPPWLTSGPEPSMRTPPGLAFRPMAFAPGALCPRDPVQWVIDGHVACSATCFAFCPSSMLCHSGVCTVLCHRSCLTLCHSGTILLATAAPTPSPQRPVPPSLCLNGPCLPRSPCSCRLTHLSIPGVPCKSPCSRNDGFLWYSKWNPSSLHGIKHAMQHACCALLELAFLLARRISTFPAGSQH